MFLLSAGLILTATLSTTMVAQSLVDLSARARQSTVALFGCSGPTKEVCRGTGPAGVVPQWSRLGSGVTVATGRLVTAGHVLKTPQVLLALAVRPDSVWQEDKLYPALVVADDDATDLAVLAVPGFPSRPADLGAKEDIKIGAEIFYIGHPSFMLGPFLGTGVVASDEMSWTVDGKQRSLYGLNATINPGNSGGGVFLRDSGRLIGIVNAKAGSLSRGLQALRDQKFDGRIVVSGVDPVAALQQTLREMEANLQLGVGAFSGIDRVNAILAGIKRP